LFHEDAQISELINLSILLPSYQPGRIRLAFREIIHNVGRFAAASINYR
jgi:hypothetical protein